MIKEEEAAPNPAKEEGLSIDPRNGSPVTGSTPYATPVPKSVHERATDELMLKVEDGAERYRHTEPDAKPIGDTHIDEVLRMAIERKASDIHLTVGLPPMVRVDGEVLPLPFHPLNPQDTHRLVYETLNDDQIHKF